MRNNDNNINNDEKGEEDNRLKLYRKARNFSSLNYFFTVKFTLQYDQKSLQGECYSLSDIIYWDMWTR